MALAGIGDNVEGTHAVAAALAAGRVTRLTVERGRLDRPEIASLVTEARALSIDVVEVDDVRPLAATTAPQGVIARARPIPLVTLEDLVTGPPEPAVLVLDHLEDPRNVGAVARSAAAAGVRSLVVSTHRAAPLGPTAFKAAVGALEVMSVCAVSSVPEALRRLSQLGLWVVGLDGGAERPLWGLELLMEPIALVVGGEGSGLSRLARQRCDLTARIPMAPGVESLNASVAASLALFELARVRSGRLAT